MIMVEQRRNPVVDQVRRVGRFVAQMREDIRESQRWFREGCADQAPDRHISPRVRLERLEAARRPSDPPADPVTLEDSVHKLPEDRLTPSPQY